MLKFKASFEMNRKSTGIPDIQHLVEQPAASFFSGMGHLICGINQENSR